MEDLQTDERGKYQLVESEVVRVAELLPHVTTDVCKDCNGGWMKNLEDDAKMVLAPWSAATWPFQLDPRAQTLLATWATKSWMAYALIRKKDRGPFTFDERRAMAVNPQPLARSRIWIMHSDAPSAHVGLGMQTTLMTPSGEVPDVTAMPDNAGFGFLAYNEIVFFVAVSPSDASPLLDLVEDGMQRDGYAKRIWPPSGTESFPTRCAPPSAMAEHLSIGHSVFQATGLPVIGLSKSEIQAVQRAYAAGVDTNTIRAIWQPDSLARLERQRISNDPDGYGKTWRPYEVLGGIEWHGGRFPEAVEHYRRAEAFGATIQQIGSQLCDALMFSGRFAEAQRVSDQVMNLGPNEWQDVFREAILHEIVDEMGLRRQKRRLRREEGTVVVSDETVRAAARHLRRTDALDVLSWSVLAHDIHEGSRLSAVMASAYLGRSSAAWLALCLQAVSCEHEPGFRNLIADALADLPSVMTELRETMAETTESELQDVRQFVEDI